MANKKNTGFHNGDLAFDLEKIKGYDKPKIKKDSYENEDVVYTIEVNDNSYMYFGKKERDKDYKTLSDIIFLGKPLLKVKTADFVEFMTDENGTDIQEIADKLIKKGSFTLEDLVETCGYIPSRVIKGKTKVPKDLRDNEEDGDFEVSPENFIVLLV